MQRTLSWRVILVAGCLVHAAALGASTQALAQNAPANAWIPSKETVGGTIAGLNYLPQQEAMLYFGFPAPKSEQSDLRLYRPATREWIEPLPGKGPHQPRGTLITTFGPDGRPGLPTINRPYWMAHQSVYVPPLGKVLFFAGGATFSYDPAARRWEHLDIALDQSPPDVMLGSMAWDPVGKRVILYGGGYISAYKSSSTVKKEPQRGKPWSAADWTTAEKRATWAFDPSVKRWAKLETGSAPFRKHHENTEAGIAGIESLAGAVRGVAFEYGDRVSKKRPEAIDGDLKALSQDISAAAQGLANGTGCVDDYERSQCAAASAKLRGALSSLATASRSLAEHDAWKALHSIEAARTSIYEAAEDLAPSPPPRYYGRLVTDTRNNLIVLFGGHGGDRALGDTWVFDPRRNQWRQSRAKSHPPPELMPAMSFDSEDAVVLLSSGWIYNAASDEWRRLTLSTPPKFFLQWTALEYDPVGRMHVALSTGDNLHGPGPVRVAHLKLDIRGTKAADSTAPRSAWLNDKYARAQAVLPRSQAEYRARVAEHRRFIERLPPNTWVRVDTSYRAQDRSYGSFALDPERGQLIFWGGGHSAYMGNEVSQYDIKGNLWMESWPPDMPPWPFGSPDGDGWNPPLYHVRASAHGYHRYAYNADFDKVLFTFGAQLFPYDVDRMRWGAPTISKSGPGNIGTVVDMGGAKGFYTVSTKHWYGGPFGVWRLEPSQSVLTRLAASDTPFATNDRAKPVYDSKRNRIIFYGAIADAAAGRATELYAYDLRTGQWSRLSPKMSASDGAAPDSRAWGIAYSAKHDAVLILPGLPNQDTWLYDCETNYLRKLARGPSTANRATNGLAYSGAHDIFLTLETGDYGVGPVSVHVLRMQ